MRRRSFLIAISLLILFLYGYGDNLSPAGSLDLAVLPLSSISRPTASQQPTWHTYANGDNVWALAFADDGQHLWAATDYGGAVLWDLATGRYSQYLRPQARLASNRLQAVHVDRLGRVWLGTMESGVSLFADGSWTTYTTGNSRLPSNNVRDIITDDQGRQWVATAGGIGLFEGNQFVEPPTTALCSVPGSLDVWSISVAPDGHLWFATNTGAIEFYGSTCKLYNTQKSGLVDNRVRAIDFETTTEGPTRTWFGTEAGVSVRYGSQWMDCRVNDSPAWNDDQVRSIAVDSSGQAWIGHNGGVTILKWPATRRGCDVMGSFARDSSGLTHDDVRDVVMDHHGQKWFATADGISTYDGSTWRSYRTSSAGLAGNTVNDMAVDSQGRIWFATSSILATGAGGLSVLSQEGWGTFREENSDMPGNSVQAITIEASQNREIVWVGTKSGIGRYDVSSRQWITYTKANTSGLEGDDVRTVAIKGGDKWFGVYVVGACAFHEFWPAEPRWLCYKSAAGRKDIHRVNTIVFDQRGVAWIGTGGGLIRCDFGRNECRTFTQTDGLAANDVRAIEIDAEGKKWLATPKGVSIYNDIGFQTWDTSNTGLISNDVHAIFIDDEGLKWFGTVAGVSVFDGSRWTNYTSRGSDLVCDDVRIIVKEGSGRMWFGTERCGVSMMDANAPPTPTPTPPPTDTATATAISGPTGTATATYVVPGTATRTATPSPTDTPRARSRAYLPTLFVAYRRQCNEGFEDGSFACWTHGGELDRAVVTRLHDSSLPHKGSYSALLGNSEYECEEGVPVGRAWMAQDFYVPPTGLSVLSLAYRIYSQDRLRDPDANVDSFDVYINDVRVHRDGNTREEFGCDNTQDTGWKTFTWRLDAYRGHKIQLRLENVSRPDSWFNTWTYVDEIQVVTTQN